MSRATEDLLDQLHGFLAGSLLEELRSYKEKDEPIPPALYGQVIKFLKDNGINAPAGKGVNPIDTLAQELADTELESDELYH